MKEQIFQRKYYRENGQLYCSTYVSGYWSNNTELREATTEELEKLIRAEQDKHIEELVKLQEILKKVLTK